MLVVTSAKNPKVKEALDLLAKRKAREAAGLFVVEGAREAIRALNGGFVLKRMFVCDELVTDEAATLLRLARGDERLVVPRSVFAKLVVREGSDGILAIFAARRTALTGLALGTAPLIVGVHGVEKPGNLGALLRSADGAGVDAVVLLDGTVDLFNPHVIRGSVGAVFGLKVAAATSDEFRGFCKEQGVKVLAAALTDDAVAHFEVDFRGATALLLGSEADGLPDAWIRGADQRVKIPMRGIGDSLNVSVAGAVLLYEALRQRGC